MKVTLYTLFCVLLGAIGTYLVSSIELENRSTHIIKLTYELNTHRADIQRCTMLLDERLPAIMLKQASLTEQINKRDIILDTLGFRKDYNYIAKRLDRSTKRHMGGGKGG